MLRVYCHSSASIGNKLLVNKNNLGHLKSKSPKQRFAEIARLTKKINYCGNEHGGCGTPVHTIKIHRKPNGIFLTAEPVKKGGDTESKELKKEPFTLSPQQCYDKLAMINDEDIYLIGLDLLEARPKDMIIKNFPIPPIQIRPTVRFDVGYSSTGEDGLTHILINIIKNNENRRTPKEKEPCRSRQTTMRTIIYFNV